MRTGDTLRLTLEKPVAGGRMLARHEGQVVLVAGGISGEIVHAVVERVQRGTVWAAVRAILESSPDRVASEDGACGGNVYAHVAYPRQLTLKAAIVQDAFVRIARHPLADAPPVVPSPAEGYRMRARLHLRGGRIGFFREGTHHLCDPASTGQLRAETIAVIGRIEQRLHDIGAGDLVDEIELAENVEATERACAFRVTGERNVSRLAAIADVDGVRGASCAVGSARPLTVWGTPTVTDVISPGDGVSCTLTRRAESFFQGNRYLLETLVRHVVARVPDGELLDLYAGVGLFAIARAAMGGVRVTAVESDRAAGEDLKANARLAASPVHVRRQTVEEFAGGWRGGSTTTVVIDPPRSGVSPQAVSAIAAWRGPRIVYVSCDVATLARDAKALMAAGYGMTDLTLFDLFPNTAHVETVATFDRGAGA